MNWPLTNSSRSNDKKSCIVYDFMVGLEKSFFDKWGFAKSKVCTTYTGYIEFHFIYGSQLFFFFHKRWNHPPWWLELIILILGSKYSNYNLKSIIFVYQKIIITQRETKHINPLIWESFVYIIFFTFINSCL